MGSIFLTTAVGRRIRRYFVRSEPHHQALASMQGLMSGALRKNGWQVAEAMGETTPYAMQHVLDRAKWDCDGMRDALRAYLLETLAASNAVLVVDETGFLKKGDTSAGVPQPYTATGGRTGHCPADRFPFLYSPHCPPVLPHALDTRHT